MTALPWQDLAADIARDPDRYIDERDRRRLLAFTRRLFPGYDAAPHHELIAAHLEALERGDLDRLIVTMPPRHGKSVLVSEHFPAWFLGRHPDRRIIACAHTQALADTFSRRARNKLADPAWPFPGVAVAGDLGNVRSWDVAGHRGGYVAAGVGGPITGHGADVLVIDDPVKSAEEADSPAFRERAWEWFQGTAMTRLQPGGRVVAVGTRWHDDDLIGRLIAAGTGWTVLHLPALADDGAALWPAWYDAEALARKRTEIGTRAFEAQYQGRPSAPEGAHYRRWWWRYWHHPGQPLPPVAVRGPGGTPVRVAPVPLPATFDEALQSWDMTFRQTEEGSYVVGQVWGRTGANRYLVDQFRARVDFPDTCLALQAMAAKWPGITTKLVENKANGPAVVAALRNRVPGLVEVEPRGGKVARALAATGIAEAANVYLPHPQLAPWVEAFVEELAAFPHGATDDQVDAYSQAMTRLEQGGGAFGFSYLDHGSPTGTNGHGTTDAFGNDLPAQADGRYALWRGAHGR